MTKPTPPTDDLQHCPTPAAQTTLIVMTSLMAMTLIVANYSAIKLWGPSNLSIDGGLLLFPLSYVLDDLLAEIYGRRTADRVAWSSCGIGFLAFAVIALVRLLPDYPGADNSAFNAISDNTGRIFIASIIGFLASQLVNNYVFERIHFLQCAGPHPNSFRDFRVRALVSSAIAHVPDILLFEPIAFFGRLSFKEFLTQAIFAYAASIMVELLLLYSVTSPLASILARRLRFRHGERT